MPILNREELHSLVGKHNDHCISIYLSMHRNEAEILQDSTRLKNLLHEAEIRLHALGLCAMKAQELLKPARHLIDQASFWRDQRDGLALFLTDGFFRYYSLPLRFPKLAVVTDRFHLKPLLRYFASDSQFYLLALSQRRVKIFQGSRSSLSEIFLEEMPVSLADTPDGDEPEKILRFNAGASSGGIRAAVFHEQVGEEEIYKYRLRRFFRWVEASLRELLKDEHAPLILAGAEYLHSIYRSVNTYRHILIEGINCNLELTPLEELQKQARTFVHSYYERARKEAKELYSDLKGTDKTTNRVSEALAAAVHGRIATLFVLGNAESWDSFDADQNIVTLDTDAQPDDESLLDLIMLRALATGGTVFAVPQEQMPDISPVAVIFHP
jgi:release factor family 3